MCVGLKINYEIWTTIAQTETLRYACLHVFKLIKIYIVFVCQNIECFCFNFTFVAVLEKKFSGHKDVHNYSRYGIY